MYLPLELAPLVFQFLPVETLEKFPQNDPLLIAVLKIQDGCRPFKVTYKYYDINLTPSVKHMGFDLKDAFSEELLLSLGVVHKAHFDDDLADEFIKMLTKTDRANHSYPFSRAEELEVSSMMDIRCYRIDLCRFPKLRKLYVGNDHRGVKITARSRAALLNYIALPGDGSSVEGVCDINENIYRYVTIEMKRDQSHGFIKLSGGCADWMPCFDRSWCRSMELHDLHYSADKVAALQGFPNLKILKFVQATIVLSPKCLPNIPLERLIFWDCIIEETEIGFWPLVEDLEFRICSMEPLKGHFPRLESLIFHDTSGCLYTADEDSDADFEPLFSVPIAKENLRQIKSFSLSTKAKRFDLSSFQELSDLEVWCSYKLTRLDGLHDDTLERVMIESCPILKVNFPFNVSVKVSSVSPDLHDFPECLPRTVWAI